MNVAVGTLLIAAADGPATVKTVSGLAFQPNAVVLFFDGRSDATDAVGRGTHYRGVGCAVSSSSRFCVSSMSRDAQAAASCACGQTTAGVVSTMDAGGGSFDGNADFTAFTSDGFTLTLTDALPVDTRVMYVALNVTNAVISSITEPGATGNVSITGIAFQPEFAFFANANVATGGAASNVDSRIMMGAAAGGGQGVWVGGSNSAADPTQTIAYCTDAECIACLETTMTAVATRASFVSFNSDGLTVNFTERSNVRFIHALLLADSSGEFAVAGGTTQTDTSTTISMPGSSSMDVLGGIVMSHGKAESTSDTPQDHDQWSVGAFTSTSNRVAFAMLDEDGLGDTEVTTAHEFDAVYANISTASAIQGLMDVNDMSAKTYIMDDADPSAFFFWNILFGTAAAAPAAATGGWDQLLSNRRNRLVRAG